MGTESFPGVKRPGRDFDHPPPSIAEVKERVELFGYLSLHYYPQTVLRDGGQRNVRHHSNLP